MKAALRTVALLAACLAALGVVAFVWLLTTGLEARSTPGPVEARVAKAARNLIIGWHARRLANPVPASEEAVADGRSHFADHCASCHGNDGSGSTELGRGLYPKAPDMRLPATQDLTDGELFYIIENGIRFTGMPGWGASGGEDRDASWRLVHFIRRLPKLTAEEIAQMEALNPRTQEELRQQIEEERFLRGEDLASPTPGGHPHSGAHK
jgi:mono/diheme cytochrome c family protein